MRVAVMGAGGMGGYFGGLLANAGHHVTFIARGVHLEALRRQGGIHLHTVRGEIFARAEAVEQPPSRPADLILFTVKSFDTQTAADAMSPAVGSDTAILSLQNGVDNEEILARLYGVERVLGGVVYMLATIKAPGVIEQPGGPGTLLLGEWRGGPSERVRRLELALREAGITVTASDDIVREKWVKFVFIGAQAGMTALTRSPIGDIRACPPTWAMYRQVMEEVVAVAKARGVALDDKVVDDHMAFASRVEPHVITSLYYDLVHGKRLELDALHGAVTRYGREAGVPTPMCEAIYAALALHDARAQRGS
ncbi:MAG: 2-dehydropantoate 2-reductase [Armatimonadota bacterium]